MTPTEKNEGYRTANEMADRQREISVSEFFLKNRHLLGFDSGAKALVTAVKEAVDNALDACEEAGILPDIRVEVFDEEDGEFRVAVEDNGPGIVENQIARIFGKLLYGSKFHKLSQSRGQQGMGISAAGMYAQLTIGKPLAHHQSRARRKARHRDVCLDRYRQEPPGHPQEGAPEMGPARMARGSRWRSEGHYQKGPHSIEMYLKQTAIANPHVRIDFTDPHGEQCASTAAQESFRRAHRRSSRIRYGIELGRLIQMLSSTNSRTLLQFLDDEFSCVGTQDRAQDHRLAGAQSDGLSDRSHPRHIAHAQATALHQAPSRKRRSSGAAHGLHLSPIGEKQLLDKDCTRKWRRIFFYRHHAAGRRLPRQPVPGRSRHRLWPPGGAGVEVDASGHMHKNRKRTKQRAAENLLAQKDEPVRLLRFANRVPLLYQQAQLRRSPRPSSRPTGAATACTNPRAHCRSRRWRSWSMSPRSGCRSPPSPRRRSSRIRKSSRR